MNKVFDIRAAQLETASPVLQRALSEIYDNFNLDICLTLMMWFSAKGIVYADLTDIEKDALLEKCKKSLDSSYGVINNLTDTGVGPGEV